MAEDVSVRFGAQTSDAEQGIQRVGIKLGELGKTAAAAFAFNEIRDAAKSLTEVFRSVLEASDQWTGQLRSLSGQLGIATEEASGLSAALRVIGIESQSYISAALQLDRQIRTNESAINRLGVVTRDASGALLGQQQLMLNAIGVLREYQAGTDRNMAAQVLFGRGAQDTTNLLRLNAEAIAEATAFAQRLGLVMDEQGVAANLRYQESINRLSLTWLAFKIRLSDEIEPQLDRFVVFFNDTIPAAIGETVRMIERAVDALGALYAVLLTRNDPELAAALDQEIAGRAQKISESAQETTAGNRPGRSGAGRDFPDALMNDAEARKADEEAMRAYVATIKTKQEADYGHYQVVMQLQQQMLDRLRGFYGEDSVQYQTALREKMRMERDHVQQIKTQFVAPFSQAFSGMVQGIIMGTQTWEQALGNMFSNILAKFIEMVAQMIIEWLIFQVITGGQGGGGGFGILGNLIPSFDVGSWSVPNDTLAMVHKGEMIVPAATAGAVRQTGALPGASGGGGGDVHLHVHATDARSVERLFRDNGAVLAEVLAKQSRNFNPNAPGWKG